MLVQDVQVPVAANTINAVTGQDLSSRLMEFPWIYTFDARTLTDGSSPQQLAIRLDGDSYFHLRRIAGLNTTAQSMRLRNAQRLDVQNNLARLGPNYAIVPELIYGPNSDISFDLGVVARASQPPGADPVLVSFIQFQGVKRWITPELQYQTPFEFKVLPYTYTRTLAIDWRFYLVVPTTPDRPRRFQFLIEDYDFEFHYLRVSYADGTPVTNPDFQIQLFDHKATRPLSTTPIDQRVVNDRSNLAPVFYDSIFPVPPMLYPANSLFTYEITSLIDTTDATFPKNYLLNFVGYARYPVR